MISSVNGTKVRTAARTVLAAALVAAAAACSVAPPTPEDHYYRLPPPDVGRPLGHPFVAATVGIAPITARGLYQERAILFTDLRDPLELHMYNYHFWVQAPSHLIQAHMVQYMRAADLAATVTRYEPGEGTSGRIGGHIERFERLIGKGRNQVTVALDLSYTDLKGHNGPAAEKPYAATVPVQGKGMEAVVTAFGTALDRISGEFLHDLTHGAAGGHP